MNEQELNELFGLEPEEHGAEAGEGAIEPETDEGGDTAAGEQIDEGEAAGDEDGAGAAAGGDDGGAEPDEDAPEPEARQQPARPDSATLERLKTEAEARQRAKLDEIVRGMGLIDPKSKAKIGSYAEYERYKAELDSERRSRDMKRLGFTSEQQYSEWLRSQPEYREQAKAAAAARRQEAENRVAGWMKEIHELDPSINEVADLGKMPNYPRFYQLVKQNGLSFVDAYKLANMDALTQRRTEAARQQMRNAEASKTHLQPKAGRGGAPAAEVTVPQNVRDIYRAMDPDITDTEIKKDYAAFMAANRKGAN